MEWCDSGRPDDAFVVVTLFDSRRRNTRDADAVTAHEHWFGLAAFVETDSVQGFAVFGTELEDMAYLDATGDFEWPGAVRSGLSLAYVAQVRRLRLVEVSAPIDTG